MSKKPLLLLVSTAALLALPGVAQAARMHGVVVKVDRQSRSIAVAQARGRVALVHGASPQALRLGSRVTLTARRLANGSYAGAQIAATGASKRTNVRGIVLRRSANGFALSASGAVLSIRMRSSFRMTASALSGPPVGSRVDVDVEIGSGALGATGASVLDPHAANGSIKGRLSIGTGKITVSDDGVSLTLAVPAGFDLSHFKNGQEVIAQFSRQPDGSLTLTSLAADDDVAKADDEDEIEDDDDDHGGQQAGKDDDDDDDGSSASSGSGRGSDDGGKDDDGGKGGDGGGGKGDDD